MSEDTWVEPRARIPLAGIVAMVLIVAVVAVFLKTQLAGFFPQTTITVTDENQNVAGSASATFQGLREISLVREERLEGILQQRDGARTFTVDVSSRLLTITRSGTATDFKLEPGADGTLTATFTFEGIATRVDVDSLTRTLLYQKPKASAQPISVPLAETVTYDGYFTYRTERLLFQYAPSAQAVNIIGRATETFPITQASDGTLAGTWARDGTDHPVTITLEKLRASIANVW